MKTRLNFTSNYLDQNNPKSEYQCRNQLIYIRDFEALKKNTQSCMMRLKTTLDFASSFKT